MAANRFFPLQVQAIRPETEDAVTVAFGLNEKTAPQFEYKHGQYLTLKFDINGKEERRAYSMSSSPLEDNLAVTVKRVQKGIVSNHIADQLQVGDLVQVMPPQGRFTVPLSAADRKTYYLFGAGSGITPLMSILKTILEKEPKSSVHLLYGNRNEDSIIFKSELDTLTQRYEGQLTVEHILSQPKKTKKKGLGGWFSKGDFSWEGQVGRIDAKAVNKFLDRHPASSKTSYYLICGPGGMISNVELALENKGISKDYILTEHFSNDGQKKAAPTTTGDAIATVHLDGEIVKVSVTPKQSIIEALVKNDHNPPYSCCSGSCSTCLAKIIKGEVKMDVHYAIDDDEVAEGYILACQAHPTTPEVEITFEV